MANLFGYDDDFDSDGDAGFDDDYSETATPGWDGTSEPREADFETFAEYEDAARDYRISQSVVKTLAKGQQQADTELNAWPDDPHQGARAEGESWLQHCQAQEADAEANGDLEAARDWRTRARMTRDELDELPAAPEATFKENAEKGFERAVIDSQLFGKEDARWDNKRLQHDSAIVCARNNQRSDGKIVFPDLDGEWGNPKPCRPSNMLSITLDEQQLENYKKFVFASGQPTDPDSVFRNTHEYLSKAGLITTCNANPYASGEVSEPSASGGREAAVHRAVDAGRAAHGDDFDRLVFNEDLQLSGEVLDGVLALDTDTAGKVLFYLGQNPDETSHLAGMHSDQSRRAIAEIGRRLSGRKPGSRIHDVSQAPPPVGGEGSGAIIITRDPESMSQAEYEKWRASGGGR